ncbi:hypothetical protein [Sphingobium yanoikuyae]|uniref:hypothetical protein n=1 Tax=Sphingobium yanoikuyae TaxID=13690 RepID=UPI0028AD4519|nr:hypothetical protein [Sphingobium yanoikuyae]
MNSDVIIDRERKRLAKSLHKVAGAILFMKQNPALTSFEMYKLRVALSNLEQVHDRLDDS